MSVFNASSAQILPSPDYAVVRSVIKDIFDEHAKDQNDKMNGWIRMLTSRIDNAQEIMLERVDQMVARSTAFEQSLLERFDALQASVMNSQQHTKSEPMMRHQLADITPTQQRTSLRDAMMQPLSDLQARITRLEQHQFGQGHQQQGRMMNSKQAMRPSSAPENPSSPPERPVFRTSMGRPSMTTDEGSPIEPRARLRAARDSSARDILTGPRGAGARSGGLQGAQGFSIVTNMQPPAPPVNASAHQRPTTASVIASAIHGVEAVAPAQPAGQAGEPSAMVFNLEDGGQYAVPEIIREAYSFN